MTVMELLEIFEVIGAICGIAAIVFLIYDRDYRSRPTMHLHPGDYAIQLRIKNMIDEAIIVDEIVATPPVIGIAEAKAAPAAILVKPYEERFIRMTLFREFEELGASAVITVAATWRTTRTIWPRKRRIMAKIMAKDVMTVLARAKE
ncbi:MAG: hypothetical protein AB7U47_15375 [Variibacter sp.]